MPNSISAKIKYLRALHGLTLEDVATAVGVGKSTVRKWETGQIANMRRDKIAKLAFALHTTPADLMGWEEGTPKAPTANGERKMTDEELKFALWGADDIDDEDLEDVRRYAAFVKERKKAKK